MNSKSSTFDDYCAIPLHQPNKDGTTASVYRFSHEFVVIATDNSQYAELSATTLSQCSGTNRIKLCRKGFSTTTDETLLCLTSLFYEYSIPALRNCLVDSVLLPEAPQASYLGDGLYHVMSRTARLQVKNEQYHICIHIHSPVSSLSYSTQLFVHTHLQSWVSCSYPRHGFLWNPTRAVRCISQTHTFFGCSLQYPTSCQRRFERVFIWRNPQRDCF